MLEALAALRTTDRLCHSGPTDDPQASGTSLVVHHRQTTAAVRGLVKNTSWWQGIKTPQKASQTTSSHLYQLPDAGTTQALSFLFFFLIAQLLNLHTRKKKTHHFEVSSSWTPKS